MGKLSQSEPADELFEESHPSCMWGIIHVLDYHHWRHSVKKMLPHKKHNGPRHEKGNGRAKAGLNVYGSDEVQKLLNAEIDLNTTKTSSTNKRSLKARIKAFISEDMSREESCRRRGPRLRRTYSIHHLEPSDPGPHGKSTAWSHPIIFLPSNADTDMSATGLQDQSDMKGTKKPGTCYAESVLDYLELKQLAENSTLCPDKWKKAKEASVNQKPMEANQPCGNTSHNQCKEYADVLELFSVNKDLFSKFRQDTEDGIANCFRNLQTSAVQARLTKSGSFPSADLSRTRNFRPTKLKHKLNEVWSFPKGENLFSGTRELDKQGSNNKVVIDPSHEFEHRIEYAVGEHKYMSSNCHEIDGSAYNLSNATRAHNRRTLSANESLERYAQLFQNSFSREAKWHLSKSLKLTNEYEIPSGGHNPVSFKRVHYLSHLDSYCSLQNELSCKAHFSGIPTRTVVDSSKNVESDGHDNPEPVDLPVGTEKYVTLEDNRETENLYTTVERSNSIPEHLASLTGSIKKHATVKMLELGEEMDGQAIEESDLDQEQEIIVAEICSNELPQPSPVIVLESSYEEEVTSPADIPTSEGLECKLNIVDEKESSVDSQHRSCSDTQSWSCSTSNAENFKIANKSVENQRHVESCTLDNDDFKYVCVVLERSGFHENGFLGLWHSLDQPLNPMLFEEVEACYWPHGLECSEEEICAYFHRQLLFDSINEVLQQIYDSSFPYYPKALSSNCRISPMPVKYRLLEEVWARISRTLSLRPGVDQSLDSVVAQDLGKDYGWMNLQLETECVALELEDIIFDELLEEILCS